MMKKMSQQINKTPKVTLYCELYKAFGGFFYKNVGTGFLSSFRNQKKALEVSKISFTEDLNEDSNIFQANSHGPITFYLAWKFKKRGRKIIFYAHSTVEDLRVEFRMIHFFSPILRWYLSRLYNFADAVVCPSEYTVKLLNDKYGVSKEKTVFISNGVDVHKFSFDLQKRNHFRGEGQINDSDIVVVDVAMAVERKGLDTFINLGKCFPNTTFFWFGKVFSTMFSKKIPNYTNNVSFVGFVKDIMQAYLSADIFLFPSYEEQQGISVLEAGAIGLPILVRDIPVYEGWLRDGENCLKAKTEDEFKIKLESLINNKDLREQLGTKIHKLVFEEHSLEAVGNKLLKLYNQLLQS